MTLEAERERGELEAPQEASWLRSRRLAIGLSLTALAQQLGAPIQTVSRWERGGNRPPWPWPLKLAEIFHVPVEEAVERLWGEKVGDPCPRHQDCGGTKILPDDPVAATLQPALRQYAEKALRLLIKIACAKCGREHEHAYPASGPHPKLCPGCSRVLKVDDVTGALNQRVKRVTCICQGYHRYGTTPDHYPSCQRERAFTHGEANEFSSGQKRPQQPWRNLDENGEIRWVIDVEWEKPFVNLAEQTYRCRSCGFASLRFNVQKARLKEASGEKIQSENQQRKLWKEFYPELTPSWHDPEVSVARRKQLLAKKGVKEKFYNQHHREATSRGRSAAAFYYPPKKRTVALCRVCDQLLSYYSSEPAVECHPSCALEVQNGNATFLPKKRRTRSEVNLKRSFSWAVRYLLFDEKYREIADDSDRDHSRREHKFVIAEIKYIVLHLPLPDRTPDRFKIALYMREAAIRKGILDAPAVASLA